MTDNSSPTTQNAAEIAGDLLARLEDGEIGIEFDAELAGTLGWHERRVTGLGLNGRTRGSLLWFPNHAPLGTKGRRLPPRFSGPRMRARTLQSLRDRLAAGAAS